MYQAETRGDAGGSLSIYTNTVVSEDEKVCVRGGEKGKTLGLFKQNGLSPKLSIRRRGSE